MTVSFETIPEGIRTSTHHVEVVPKGPQGLLANPKKVLVCGIKLPSGTLSELTPTRILSPNMADQFGGVGSPVARMCKRIKQNRPMVDVYMCAIDANAGGTAGTKTLTIVGTTTAAGTLHLYVQGVYIPVAIPSGTAPTAAATAVVAAFNAHRLKPEIAYTCTSSSGVVTFTMRWAGVEQVDIRVNYQDGQSLPPGMTSATVAVGTPGAGNPDVEEIIDVMGAEKWHRVVTQFTDATNMLALETELDRRYGGDVQLEGHIFAAFSGDHSATSTYGAARNSRQSTVLGISTSPIPSWEAAAILAGEVAAQSDPALPLHIRLPGILPPARSDRWDQSERNLLLYDGIGTVTWDDGGNCNLERPITTYQTNSLSVEDPTWLDLEWKLSIEYVRFDCETAPAIAFGRYKLADDATELPPGQKIVTPSTMRVFLGSRYDLWAAAGIVEPGPEKKQAFLDEMFMARDISDVNRLVGQITPDMMNQYRGMSLQLSPYA